MALVTLLEYLKNNKLKHSLVIGDDIVINNVGIQFYEISQEYCWIKTDRGDDVKLHLKRFKRFAFDAIVSTPTNSVEMIRSLNTLEKYKPYNAYLETDDGEFLAGFYHIGREDCKTD